MFLLPQFNTHFDDIIAGLPEITSLSSWPARYRYLAAVTPLVAALLGLPYSWISNRVGKGPIMVFGALNYIAVATIVTAMSQDALVNLGWGLVGIYVIVGSGRSVFENTNKATFADFFPNDLPGAFANVIVQSGGSSAAAFIIFPYVLLIGSCLACCICSE